VRLELLVEQSLGEGRFVVTNNSRHDIPLGTVFTSLFTLVLEPVDRNFQEREVRLIKVVRLSLIEVDFWRKPHTCVQYGHHAGVRLKGEGMDLLEEQVNEREELSHVVVATEPRHA
jgi:hypothetical protein